MVHIRSLTDPGGLDVKAGTNTTNVLFLILNNRTFSPEILQGKTLRIRIHFTIRHDQTPGGRPFSMIRLSSPASTFS